MQLCKEASCGQRFSQLGNLKVTLIRTFIRHILIYSRRTSDDTLVNDLIHARAAANASPNVAMSALTRSCINRSSHLPVGLKHVESNSPN